MVSTWETACGIAGYSGNLVGALRELGVEVDVVPIDRPALAYLTRAELRERFLELVSELEGHDVVHVQHEFGFFAGAYGYVTSTRVFGAFLAALQRRASPVVVTFHTEPLFFAHPRLSPQELVRRSYYTACWRAFVARRLTAGGRTWAVVHTRTSRRLLLDAGAPSARTRVIRQGVEAREPPPASRRPAALERFGLPADAVVLGIFGFLSSVKGHVTAIRALRHLPDEYHLLIAGEQHPQAPDRTLERVLELLDRRPRLRERVHLAGYLDDEGLEDYLAAVDIAVAPYEEQPRLSSSAAVTWALAAGKPIVASRIPAFAELAVDAEGLELVNPRAPRELARALQRLAADPARRDELRAGVMRYAGENGWGSAAGRHLALYETVGQSRRHAPGAVATARRLEHAAARRLRSIPRRPLRAGKREVPVRVAGAPPATFVLRAGAGDPIADWLATHRRLADPPNELVLGLLADGGRLVDVGAHIGTFTLPAAAQGCEVVAVEASPVNADLLREAVVRNGFDGVTVVNAVAGSRAGTARFTPSGPWGHRSLPGESVGGVETVEMPLVSIDDLVEARGWPSVDVVKVDTEGSEPEVLAGAERLLRRPDAPIVVFESNADMLEHYGHRAEALRARFSEWGFDLFLVDRHEERRLVPVDAGSVQFDCVADYVAAKRPLRLTGGWRVAEPLSDDDVVARLLEASRSSHWPYRRYAARTLRVEASWLDDRDDVRDCLRALAADDQPEVRAAAQGKDGRRDAG